MAISNSIRKDVGKKVNDFTKNVTNQQKQNILTSLDTQTGGRYRAIAKAAMEVHQATGKNRTPESLSENTKKTYAAALQLMQEDRKIKGAGKEGEITSEQLGKELSPEEVMKFAFSKYLEENKEKLDDARKDLSMALDETNIDEPQAIKEIQSFIKNAPVYLTDDAFLEADEDTQNAYINSLGGFEKDRLAELLKAKKELGPDPKDIGKVKMDHNDPDWAHQDDKDDFKIESGDIIEYLMKDVILAGTAWALNKPSGFVGTLAYECVHHGVHKLTDMYDDWYPMEYIKKKWNDLFSKKNPAAPFDPQEHLVKQSEFYKTVTSAFERQTKAYRSKTEEDLKKEANYLERLGKHLMHFSDDGTIKYLFKGNYVTKNENPNSQEFKDLLATQNMLHNLAREHLRKAAGETIEEEALQAFDTYTKDLDEAIIAGKKPEEDGYPKMPDKPEGFSRLWNDAHKKAAEDTQFEQEKKLLVTEKEIFCTYYAQYKTLEHFKKNKENPECQTFVNEDNIKTFFAEQQKEAAVLFYTAQKQRAEGKNIPSNAELIEMSKDLFTKSTGDVKQNRSDPVADKILDKISPPTEQKEREDMAKAAEENITKEDFLNHRLSDIDTELRSLGAASGAVDEKRKALEERKRRLGLLKPEAMKDKTATAGKVYSSSNFNAGGQR